jgi:hypothetical protein
MTRQVTDEDLMAFADGKGDPELMRTVAAAVAADPKLAARADMFRSGARTLKQAFPPLVNDEKDKALAELIKAMNTKPVADSETGKVLQFRPKPKPAGNPVVWQRAAAAVVVLGLGLAGGYLLPSPSPTLGPVSGPGLLALAPDVQAVLGKSPTGTVVNLESGALSVIASFKDKQDHFCREFEQKSSGQPKSIAVACLKSEGWHVVIMATVAVEDGFTPAAGAETIETFLQNAGMTQPLSLEQEKQLLKP